MSLSNIQQYMVSAAICQAARVVLAGGRGSGDISQTSRVVLAGGRTGSGDLCQAAQVVLARREEALRSGAKHYLVKPINHDELIGIIKNIV